MTVGCHVISFRLKNPPAFILSFENFNPFKGQFHLGGYPRDTTTWINDIHILSDEAIKIQTPWTTADAASLSFAQSGPRHLTISNGMVIRNGRWPR